MATSRIYDIRSDADPILTNVVKGYANNSFIADIVMPIVTVDSETGTYRSFGEERFKIYETKRALRASSNRIDPAATVRLPYQLDEHDLEEPIDYRENFTDRQRQANAANRVAELLTLGREKRVADLIQATGTYASGHTTGLSGSSQFSHDDSDPIATINTGKAVVSGKIGVDPNVLLLSKDVCNRLLAHPGLIERVKYSGLGVLTLDTLKALFQVDKIVVGQGIYSPAGSGLSNLYTKTAALLYVNPATVADQENPTFGYTFRLKGFPTADIGDENRGKIKVVRSTDINKQIVVGNTSGYLIYNALA